MSQEESRAFEEEEDDDDDEDDGVHVITMSQLLYFPHERRIHLSRLSLSLLSGTRILW